MDIFEACIEGDVERVRYLLDIEQVNPNQIRLHVVDKKTPLHHAASNGHLECMKLLIESKADINCKDLFGWSCVHSAAWKGHLECMKLLILESKIDVNCQSFAGSTPLMFASQCGFLPAVQFLVEECGADVWIKDDIGAIATHFAINDEVRDYLTSVMENAEGGMTMTKSAARHE